MPLISFLSDTLVTLDTNGILRNLLCSVGWKWTPVLDLNQAKRTPDHRLWPVTVKGNKLSHVLLNGESRPATYPQPVTSMKIFKLPITEAKDGKDSMAQNDRIHSMLWEGMMTSHFEALKGIETTTGTLPEGLSSEDLQKKVDIQQGDCDKSILTLFQFACQQQRNEQAMGYAHRLRTDVGLQSATQIADHFGRTSIAAAVDAILTAKREMENEIAWQQQQQQGQGQGHGQGQGQDEADSNGMHYESQADIEVIEVPSEKVSQLTKLSRRSTGNKNRVEEEDDNYESNSFEVEKTPAPKPQPVNPFAVKGSPVKRKSIQESMRDMKASPSPKKATLSVSVNYSSLLNLFFM